MRMMGQTGGIAQSLHRTGRRFPDQDASRAPTHDPADCRRSSGKNADGARL